MNERYERDITNYFPYPIASIFKKLRTDEGVDPGPLRLKFILATAEAITRFLGMVTLCECRRHIEEQGIKPSKSLTMDFSKNLKRPSWGIWTQFLREGIKCLHENASALLIPKLYNFYFDKIPAETASALALGRLLTIRNGLSHDKIKAMRPSEFKNLCDETYPLLSQALENLDFLLDYELTFVSQIEALKRRRMVPDFLHRLKKITGESDSFSAGRETMVTYLDSRAIIVMNKDSRKYLNLDPLLLHEESAGKAPDIFYYNGMDTPGKADYAPCKHGGAFTSAEAERAEEIKKELEILLKLFSVNQEKAGGS